MRKLNFNFIMGFNKLYNRSIYDKIVEARQNGTLIPFAGAGLSVPVGYKQRGGILRNLFENIIDADKKTLVLDQIKNSKYEETAGTILDSYVETCFNLRQVQQEADIPTTVSYIAAFLREHPGAISGFKEAMNTYFSKHPGYKARYQPLLEQ